MSEPRSIEIDEEVWRRLQEDAVPLVDTPNTVLRRLLAVDRTPPGEAPHPAAGVGVAREPDAFKPLSAESTSAAKPRLLATRSKTQTRRGKGRAKRASSADLLPESEYELPILRALAEAGGRAPTREVLSAVGTALDAELTPVDRDTTASGGTRWHGRAHLVRLRLVESGDMLSDSPRGVWEISDQGSARVAKDKGAK
jgi:hypothetical protein